MLKTLSIWNFALIEHVQIDFDKGLNILTGETGAGKSILLGALGMVIGRRTNIDAIRSGCEFMRVEAVFTLDNNLVKDFLTKYNILVEDDDLIITRQININGKNSIQINNCHTTMAILRQLGELLVDIHGQHANQALLKPIKQLSLIDMYDGDAIQKQKEAYLKKYYRWLQIKQKLADSKINTQEMAQRLDMLKWQINEIENAKLTLDEDEKLESEIKVLANAEKISLLTQDAYKLLYEGENGKFAILSSLSQVRKDLENLAQYDENMAKVHQILDEAYFQIQDSADEIRSYGESIDYNPQKLDMMQSRLNDIDKLKRKYGNTIEEILNYLAKAKEELTYIENYDDNLAKLEQELSLLAKDVSQEALILHELRQKSAKALEMAIMKELASLSMADAKLVINLTLNNDFTENGADDVEILFSANLGEDLKSLAKIVSGGELSRIALALKTITAKKDDIDLMVFDEVDTGVGGKTAQMMAEKIARIALYRQVICITHLPQIAAMADQHFLIEKKTEDAVTRTHIYPLTEEKSVEELARILGGAKITDTVIQSAKEMKNLAGQIK